MSVTIKTEIETEYLDNVKVEEDKKQSRVFLSINNCEYASLRPDDIDAIISALTRAKQNIYKS